ncbi:lysosomal acid lipase/cholesteryl ester hydrolase [Galendromus occidentalis]|uniref:Lysosomal acid lipase/cholesteryl ester hydrolase n=1 Tax=Galendromus occidentalis TaxID=34638 RepID=A0AAJ7SIP3_9ACAR|nr:lysosomal acid lipase/cholesteryl ester hydrolase [Galendromus occidentalis]
MGSYGKFCFESRSFRLTIGIRERIKISELVLSKGFIPEEHHVITEDKYILGVVYISTPLFLDSDAFVADFANNSLAFLLADNGFDVWIGNIRGTKYSRAMVGKPDPSASDTSFFDYTFIDAGLKDIPAGIEYALAKTGRLRLFYVGHSQATAGLFALLSYRPEFNEKIIAMAALCPFRRISCNVGQDMQFGTLANIAHFYRSLNVRAGASLDTMDPCSSFTIDKLRWLQALRSVFGEFPPKTGLHQNLLCKISNSLCAFALHFGLGTAPNLNQSRLDVYVTFMPAPTSLKNLVFFGQVRRPYICRVGAATTPTKSTILTTMTSHGAGEVYRHCSIRKNRTCLPTARVNRDGSSRRTFEYPFGCTMETMTVTLQQWKQSGSRENFQIIGAPSIWAQILDIGTSLCPLTTQVMSTMLCIFSTISWRKHADSEVTLKSRHRSRDFQFHTQLPHLLESTKHVTNRRSKVMVSNKSVSVLIQRVVPVDES